MCRVLWPSPACALLNISALYRAQWPHRDACNNSDIVISRITLRWLQMELGAPLQVLAAPSR